MRVIKDGAVVDDGWVLAGAEDTLPDADVIVPFDRWRAERAALAARPYRLGVAITGDHDLAEVAADLAHFDLIALEFPQFKDGRNYSNARLLRERHGYRGELRAVGDVLRDQIFYLHRCGIDSFAVRADQDIEAAVAGLEDFSQAYQPVGDDRIPVFRFRST